MSRALLLSLVLATALIACRAPAPAEVKGAAAPADTIGTGFVRHDTTMIDSPLSPSRR